MAQINFNQTITSKNFSPRIIKPGATAIKYIVLHFTEIPLEKALHRLCDPMIQVSCHYLVAENGIIYKLVDDAYKAWHAGISYWRDDEALNNNSIGIEIDNDGKSPFKAKQITSLITLCKCLKVKYNISPANFIGHADIAPNRKIDPGIFFPWQTLATQNIGIWPAGNYVGNPSNINKILHDFGDINTEVLNLQLKLQKFGYKIEPTSVYDKQTSDVVRAFKARFQAAEICNTYTISQYFDLDTIYLWSEICEWQLNQLLILDTNNYTAN